MLLRMDEVTAKPATQFLFVAEYMIRKNRIEANEQKAQMNKTKSRL